MKSKDPRIAKKLLKKKKNKQEDKEANLSYQISRHYKLTVIKTVLIKDRKLTNKERRNGVCIFEYLIYDKMSIADHWGNSAGTEKIGFLPYAI